MFSIDSSTENIRVPEKNESVEVCIRRTGDTVNDYNVTLEAKMNTGGNIANGNRISRRILQYYIPRFLSILAPADFTAELKTVSFPSGQTTLCVEFDLNPDDIALEGDEQFNVMITTVGSGAEIGSPSTSSITIVDDDG